MIRLIHKLTTPDEISGIFNLLMYSLRILLKNKGIYLNEKTMEERRTRYKRAVNPIQAFLDEAVEKDSLESDSVVKIDLYDAHIKHWKNTEFLQNHKWALARK